MAIRQDETGTAGTTQIDGAWLHAFLSNAVADIHVFEVGR
jgi:hypothetical protein